MVKKITQLSIMMFLALLGYSQPTISTDLLFSKQTKQNQLHPNDSKDACTIKYSLDELIRTEWIDSTSQWMNNNKSIYVFNEDGTQSRTFFLSWDANNSEWNTGTKDEYTYDDNGHQTTKIHYIWKNSENQWSYSYKEEYTYDENGNKSTSINYFWNNSESQWSNSYKEEYTYDENGHQTTIIHYAWNHSLNEWLYSYKDEFTYDENGHLMMDISYIWQNTQWLYSSKNDYSYDENGNINLQITYHWNESLSLWRKYSKSDITYNEYGTLLSYTLLYWNDEVNQWKNTIKNDFTYDFSVPATDLIVPSWFGFNGKLSEVISYNWDETTNSWVNESKSLLFYSEIEVTGVKELINSDVLLYPNPANNNLHIQITNNSTDAIFELYDIQGQRLISRKLSTTDELNIEHLNSGMYIYSITIDGNKQSGKLVKR